MIYISSLCDNFVTPLNTMGNPIPYSAIYRVDAITKKVSPTKIGKAGELLVANELLRRGFDVYIPLVDAGIDLICMLDRNPILIQVKESKLYPSGRYWLKMSEKNFLKNVAENMFYVFVLKAKNTVNYLVLPSTFIEENKDKLDFGKTGMINFYFEFDEKGEVFETRKSNICLTGFLNDFNSGNAGKQKKCGLNEPTRREIMYSKTNKIVD